VTFDEENRQFPKLYLCLSVNLCTIRHMPRLAVSLFGPFHVTLDGAPVTEFKTNKGQALLAYLAVEANRARVRKVGPSQ